MELMYTKVTSRHGIYHIHPALKQNLGPEAYENFLVFLEAESIEQAVMDTGITPLIEIARDNHAYETRLANSRTPSAETPSL